MEKKSAGTTSTEISISLKTCPCHLMRIVVAFALFTHKLTGESAGTPSQMSFSKRALLSASVKSSINFADRKLLSLSTYCETSWSGRQISGLSCSWPNIGGLESTTGSKKRFDSSTIVHRKSNSFGNPHLVPSLKLPESLGSKEKSGQFLFTFMDTCSISWFTASSTRFTSSSSGSIPMTGELSTL